jgi:hypothetical protein
MAPVEPSPAIGDLTPNQDHPTPPAWSKPQASPSSQVLEQLTKQAFESSSTPEGAPETTKADDAVPEGEKKKEVEGPFESQSSHVGI